MLTDSHNTSSASETSLAWAAGKSLLPFQVRRFFDRTGYEVVILIDRGRGPAFYPTVFMTCLYDKKGYPPSTREKVLRALGMARAWAGARGRDLDEDLRHGPFLSLADAESLADHLMLSVEAQAAANIVAAEKARPTPRIISKLERLRPHRNALASVPEGLEPANAVSHIQWVALYVEWHLGQRMDTADRSVGGCADLAIRGPRVLARLRERGRRGGNTSSDNEALEGVSQEVIDLVSDALRPGDPQNPFKPGYIQARNELAYHFYISSGARRSEVLSMLVKNVSFSQRQMYISKSKTRARWVPISRAAAEKFEMFIDNYWSKMPQARRRKGLLFTSEKGEPLNVRAINRMFVTIRTRVPGCPAFLTPHTARRSFSDRLCEHVDALPPDQRMPEAQELQVHNKMLGWVEGSEMSGRYAKRHIRNKADELGEQLANSIGKGARNAAGG
jgi:integrase